MISITWFGVGLLFWPGFLIARGRSDSRARPLGRTFFVTLAALGGVGLLLGTVALMGRFNHNWLPVTLLFPLINVVSIVSSIQRLRGE